MSFEHSCVNLESLEPVNQNTKVEKHLPSPLNPEFHPSTVLSSKASSNNFHFTSCFIYDFTENLFLFSSAELVIQVRDKGRNPLKIIESFSPSITFSEVSTRT
jgi:hypothetical protein